jgi:hypothetical protein
VQSLAYPRRRDYISSARGLNSAVCLLRTRAHACGSFLIARELRLIVNVRRFRILVFGLFTPADWYFWEKHKLKHYDVLDYSVLYLASNSKPNTKSKWEITNYNNWVLIVKTEKLLYYCGTPLRTTEVLFRTIIRPFQSSRG